MFAVGWYERIPRGLKAWDNDWDEPFICRVDLVRVCIELVSFRCPAVEFGGAECYLEQGVY